MLDRLGELARPVLPAMKAMLSKLPQMVQMGRVATKDAAAAADPKLMGGKAERLAAIGAMFPDLPAAGA